MVSCTEENTGTTESLEFYYQLGDIENNILNLFNKLNNYEYIKSIVNLSSHSLTNMEMSVLLKVLGFCSTSGEPDIGISSKTWMFLKEELDFNYFSLVPIRIQQNGTPNQGYHLTTSPSNSNHPSIH